MKITLLTYGSRGDLEPFLALAKGLKVAGHTVKLAAPQNFEEYVRAQDVTFISLPGDTRKILSSPEGADLLRSGNSTKFVRDITHILRNYYERVEDKCLEACQDAELIVGAGLTLKDTICISDKLKIRACILNLQPVLPGTSAFPNFLITTKNLRPKMLNKVTHLLFDILFWKDQKKYVQKFRARLGLPPLDKPLVKSLISRKIPILHAYSSLIVTPPKDWDGLGAFVGHISAPTDASKYTLAKPNKNLIEWLSRPDKPIFFGFGSMPLMTEKALNLISEALRKLMKRGVIVSSWSETPILPSAAENLLMVTEADYRWLLPKCAVAVHHGGAGTTHDALLAGIPSVVCPSISDQFFWAKRVSDLKVGIDLSFKNFNEARLVNALKYCLETSIAKNAREFSLKMVKDGNGLQNTISFIEKAF